MVLNFADTEEIGPSSSSSPHRRVIPAGIKVFFRWANRRSGNSLQNNNELFNTYPDQLEMYMEDEPDTMGSSTLRERDSNAFTSNPVATLFLSFPGFLLLFALGLFITLLLIRLARGACSDDDADDDADLERGGKRQRRHQRGSRALHVMLVPKASRTLQQNQLRTRPNSIRSKSTSSMFGVAHSLGFDLTNERKLTTMSMLYDGATSAVLKPFPRRIYELQAEEGYFSCPSSKRTSMDMDD